MMKLSSTKINRYGWSLATMAMLLILTGGCSIIATTMWVFTGNEVPAKFNGLKGKKVVVVCRGPNELQLRNPTAPGAIAKRIGSFLQTNLSKKTEVISQQEVSRFTDEHDWHDYTEVGEGMAADMVIGIELESFYVKSGGGLYRGHATIKIKVYDMKNKGRVVYEKSIPGMKYPVMNEVAWSDVSEAQFNAGHINYVAELVARHFYSHDPNIEPGKNF